MFRATGDSVAEALVQMGYTVIPLSANDLTEDGLRGLDAVVVGIRAFNVRTDLAPHLPALFAFSEAGGNVIVQYNRPNGLKANQFAPYDLRISQDRVTNEQSPVTFLRPSIRRLTSPIKLHPRILMVGCKNEASTSRANGMSTLRRLLPAMTPARRP